MIPPPSTARRAPRRRPPSSGTRAPTSPGACRRALRHPRELDPVVDYLTRSLALSLWLEETRLAYYLSWDEQVLRRPDGGVAPARECRAALQAVAAARTKEDKHHRVEQDWHNCVNSAARRDLGAYPAPAWQAFLVAYGIRERLVEIDGDPLPVRR
ncbi:MAG TPA: hypothetical protein VMR23_09005 [Candidatus Limnocylindria bacterium]|nr:hypothetical protein [Candidatus Limnocylindria bacterium]